MFGWVWTIAPLWWFVLAVSGGLLLLIVGWWGRRIGDEPRCRKCGYILLKLPTTICPDCGTDFAKRKPRRGVRKVRPIALIAASVVLLSTISPALWVWRNAAWRTQAPVWLLLSAIDFGDRKSWSELDARVRLGDALTDPQLREIARRALDAQRSAPLHSGRLRVWLDALGALDQKNMLTDTEWAEMLRQSVRELEFKARARCRADRPWPTELRVVYTAPPGTVSIWKLRAWIPGSATPVVDAPLGSVNVDRDLILMWLQAAHERPPTTGEHRQTSLVNHEIPVGEHVLEVELTTTPEFIDAPATTFGGYRFFSFAPSQRARLLDDAVGAASPRSVGVNATFEQLPSPTIKRTLQQRIVVVPAGSDGDLDIVSGPQAVQTVRESLRPVLVEVQSGTRDEGLVTRRFEATIRAHGSVPWTLAFHVRVRVDDAEEPVCHFVYSPIHGAQTLDAPRPDWSRLQGKTVELMLIPDPEPIRRTLDLTYFAETVVLDPLLLAPAPVRQ